MLHLAKLHSLGILNNTTVTREPADQSIPGISTPHKILINKYNPEQYIQCSAVQNTLLLFMQFLAKNGESSQPLDGPIAGLGRPVNQGRGPRAWQ